MHNAIHFMLKSYILLRLKLNCKANEALMQVFRVINCFLVIQIYFVTIFLNVYNNHKNFSSISPFVFHLISKNLLLNNKLCNQIGKVALFLEKWWVRRVVRLPSGETAEWWNSRVVTPPGGENAMVRAPWWKRRVVRTPGIQRYSKQACFATFLVPVFC